MTVRHQYDGRILHGKGSTSQVPLPGGKPLKNVFVDASLIFKHMVCLKKGQPWAALHAITIQQIMFLNFFGCIGFLGVQSG